MKRSQLIVCVVIALVTFVVGYAVRPMAAPAVVGDGQDRQVFNWIFQMHGSAHPSFPIYQQWAKDIE